MSYFRAISYFVIKSISVIVISILLAELYLTFQKFQSTSHLPTFMVALSVPLAFYKFQIQKKTVNKSTILFRYPKSISAIFLIFYAITAAGIGYCMNAYAYARTDSDMNSWPSTEATITGYYIKTIHHYKPPSTDYLSIWTYTILKEDQIYESASNSTEFVNEPALSNTLEDATTVAQTKPVGLKILVQYNPKNPTVTVLNRAKHINVSILLSASFGLLLTFIGAWLIRAVNKDLSFKKR